MNRLQEQQSDNVTYITDCFLRLDQLTQDRMYGGVENEKMFKTEFKNRRRDLLRGWFSHMAESERFDLYGCFNNTLERERYLELLQSRVYKTA